MIFLIFFLSGNTNAWIRSFSFWQSLVREQGRPAVKQSNMYYQETFFYYGIGFEINQRISKSIK